MKIKTLLATVVLLLSAQHIMCDTLAAQNFIKKITMEGGPSIVRTIDKSHWLTYCENRKGRKDFYIVPQSGTVVDNMQINDQTIHISDFVILSDTVYFCGKQDQGDSPVAVMGCFSIAGAQFGPVIYELFPEALSFNAIDVFRLEGHIYAVVTATALSGLETKADIRHLSGNYWECNIVEPNFGAWTFDDVAVTARQIIYTSRAGKDNKNKSRIWFIDRPAIYGTSVFLSPIPYNEFSLPYLAGKMLVSDAGGGWFFTVAPTLSGTVLMHRYAMSSYLASVEFNGIGNFTVNDITYAFWPNIAEVLVATDMGGTADSRIYHIPGTAFERSTTADIHLYSGYEIHSLDVADELDSLFVASGRDFIYDEHHVFRHKLNNYKCAENEWTILDMKDYSIKDEEIDILTRNKIHKMIYTGHNVMTIELTTMCGNQ